jgi:hypothetical protein
MQTKEELVKEVADMKVFEITTHISVMIVSTSKTLSKVNFKRLMKMNNNIYMKVINFTTELTTENLMILKDISLKTNKYSQETLNDVKKARLQGKFKNRPTASRSVSSSDAYDHWMDVVGYEPSREQLAAHIRSLNK